jgi:RNA polymerase sigma-70 factor (ECF subfamily)
MAGEQVAELSDESLREDAFRHLAERHLERSYRLACAILGNASEAQDATQDAFVQAWRRWSTLRDPGRFEHWFDKILVNICRNRLRRSTRWQTQDISDDLLTVRGDPYDQAVDRDLIGTALKSLSPEHRLVVALRYYRDLSVAEIADRLGVRQGTVSSRLHYAVKRLHAVIDSADAEGMHR